MATATAINISIGIDPVVVRIAESISLDSVGAQIAESVRLDSLAGHAVYNAVPPRVHVPHDHADRV